MGNHRKGDEMHGEEKIEDIDRLQEDLRRSYEELKELDRLRRDILANVTHELRTPITICINAIELAMDEASEEKRKKFLRVGKNALIDLNHIVGDLLDLVSTEKGFFKPGEEGLDLERVIKMTVEQIEPLTLKKGVSIKTKIEKLPKVRANEAAMKHVFFNLLSNAIKFNKVDGGVNVEAIFKEDPLRPWGEGFVEVSVADTGIGIPEEHLDKVFDRFYQIDSSATRKYGGTGMGLAVVKEIIEAQGGEIWVESEVGRGSKFSFTIPEEPRIKGKNL
ncbi:MAG: sensor histidine kinase [Candidatus Hydrothermarchaeales archaeon]